MDLIICIRKAEKYLEEEHYKGFRKWESELYNDRRIFIRSKRRIW